MPLTTGGGYNPNFMRPDGMNFGLGGGGRQNVDLTGGRQSNQQIYAARQPSFAPPPAGQAVPPTGPYPQRTWGDGNATPAEKAAFMAQLGQAGQAGQPGYPQPAAYPQPPQPQNQPAWMGTPDGQRYMAALVAQNPQAAMEANPNAWNANQFGIAAGGSTAPATGLIGSEQALMQALQGATGTLNTGLATADNFLSGSAGAYDPYIQPGLNAFGLQADLAGVNGQGAFDAAFTESPVQAFLRQQGERSVTQNAAALGGLGGGNVMKELTRYGTGVAGTQLQQQFDNLGRVTNLGFDATGNQANINNARGNLAYQNAGTIASGIGSAGQLIAANRNQAGRDEATAIGNATSALADLVNSQGAGVSDIYGAGGSNIANILTGIATQTGMSQQNMAIAIANAITGQASQVAGLPAIGQFVQPDPTLANVASVAGGVGSAITAYNSMPQPAPTPVTTPVPVATGGGNYTGTF